MPKVDYPVVFADGQLGFNAKQPIEHREMLIAVPYNLAINVQTALKNDFITEMVKQNPQIFGTIGKEDLQGNLIITLFIMIEK
jgi:hypothetical protein